MRIDGAIWNGDSQKSPEPTLDGGWELQAALSAADRARHQLTALQAAHVDHAAIEQAQRRCRDAARLVRRIRSELATARTHRDEGSRGSAGST